MDIQAEVARRVRNGINALKSELRAGGVDEAVLDRITIVEQDTGINVEINPEPRQPAVASPSLTLNEGESSDEVDENTGFNLSKPVYQWRKASKDDGEAE